MPRMSGRSLLSAGLRRRKKWNEEEGRQVVAAVARSGLSVREFAARAGVDEWRVYRWRSVLRGKPAKVPAFVEVKAAAGTVAIEAVLKSGHAIRVARGFDEETLRRLVTILEGQDERC